MEEQLNKKINILKEKIKNLIELIIFLLIINFFLMIYLKYINILTNYKQYVPIILKGLGLIIFITSINLIIKLIHRDIIYKKLSKLFTNKLEIKRNIDDYINDLTLTPNKGIEEDELERIDIFSKENRQIKTNNLIKGIYKCLYFKEFDIELIDNKDKIIGKWFILNTKDKDTYNVYVSSNNTYNTNLLYPKEVYEKYKNKKKVYIKTNNKSKVKEIIDLSNKLNKDIYISNINNKLNIFIIDKSLQNISNIEDELNIIFDFLDIIKKEDNLELEEVM